MATSTLGSGTLVLAGTTSGTTTVTATAVAGTTTLTLPAATDTLVGKATTDTLTNKTLTGAVMNGTLGATTPSTVAATTLTTSSTVTHNGGTANGVAYLNGSKVLTTGSGLVFDGTNLGVGVTPSAWQVNNRAIQLLEGYASISSNNSQGCCDVAFNCFNGGSAATSGWKYTNTGVAVSLFQQQAGAFKFLTAASGTAGNAITFTQAMTLDASGNLGVGETSPTAKLHISVASAVVDGTKGVKITNPGGTAVMFECGVSGDSFIGTTSGSDFNIRTGNTVRATFDNAGNLLVGTTSSSGGGGSSGKMVVQFNGAATNGIFFDDTRTSAGTDNAAIFSRGTTIVGRLDTTLSSLALTNLSDQRVKTNVQNSENSLDLINSLKVRQFDWTIDQTHEDFGFVAQELNEVLPQAVSIGKTEEEMWGVNYIKLVPILTKAIQEQQALITTLTARITALESA